MGVRFIFKYRRKNLKEMLLAEWMMSVDERIKSLEETALRKPRSGCGIENCNCQNQDHIVLGLNQ